MFNVIISNVVLWGGMLLVTAFAFYLHFRPGLQKITALRAVCLGLAVCYLVGVGVIYGTGYQLANGQVEHFALDDSYYTGTLKDGKPYGLGSLTLPDGTILRCTFRKGEANGSGELTLTDGSAYTGEIKNRQMDGFGSLVQHSQNGNIIFTGNFVKGAFTGSGTIQYPDGRFYQGKAVNFKPSGIGTMTLTDGSVYQGNFADGLFHGMGTFTCAACGHSYEGEWACGRMNGEGTLTLKNGTLFAGNWLSDHHQKKLFYCDNPYYKNNKLLALGVPFTDNSHSFKATN